MTAFGALSKARYANLKIFRNYGARERPGTARLHVRGSVTVEVDQADSRPGWWRRAFAAVVAGLGWLLSPLSWWNDLVVNVPLAYLFSVPFSLIDERFYVPAFALGYWLTNVLGFVLLHKGVTGMISTRRTSLKHDLLIATAYTVVVVIVASLGWLPSPATLLEQWRAR